MSRHVFNMVVIKFFIVLSFISGVALAAPQYASVIMDNRSGEILRSRNADTRLHPASLTKMMTLYITFEAIKKGEITAETIVTVSKKAASEPPSRMGLRTGQKIKLKYLIRAAAIMSANDAATAIGEAISGSEAAFSRRMNKTAKALGMSRTTFKNCHGLTEVGHLSTANDMTKLGRNLFYHYNDYYHLFSRRTHTAGQRRVKHTNTRFLNTYAGADGIKTGYTRKAGFNLVASAERKNKRIIVTVFGGKSTTSRNKEVKRQLDIGFNRAREKVAIVQPSHPTYGTLSKGKSPHPYKRPPSFTSEGDLVNVISQIKNNVQEARLQSNGAYILKPSKRPNVANKKPNDINSTDKKIIIRTEDKGPKIWRISLGAFTTRDKAERHLLKATLTEIDNLKLAVQDITFNRAGWKASFIHLNKNTAEMTCEKLIYQGYSCEAKGPDI
mgnify:FL=1